jgi:hypothetical protein
LKKWKILGAAFMLKGTIGESQESSIKKKKRKCGDPSSHFSTVAMKIDNQ